ncbi:MAG: CHASE2 domain-containing protein [Desulfobacteraceae bacterium]
MLSRVWKVFRLSYLKLTIWIILGHMLLMAWEPNFIKLIELKIYDLMFQMRGAVAPGPEVVIVAIDDASIKALGRWPWSRRQITRLVERLDQAQARVVGFDMIFAEKEEETGLRVLKELQAEIDRRDWRPPGFQNWLQKQEKVADPDGKLAQALGQQGAVVLGYYFPGLGSQKYPGGDLEMQISPELLKSSAYNLVRWQSPRARQFPLLTAPRMEANIPRLMAAAARTGYFNATPDDDGTIRRLPLVIRHRGELVAPLPLGVLQQYLGNPPLGITIAEHGVSQLRLGNRQIPVDNCGRFLINFRGPAQTFKYYSFIDVVQGRVPLTDFEDRIVLVGATAVGIYDIRVTPFESVYPGVEVHATVIDNILQQDYLKNSEGLFRLDLWGMIALSLLLGGCLPRLRAAGGFLLFLFMVAVYITAGFYLFMGHRLHLQMVYPLNCLATVYVGVTLMRFLAEERERRRIRAAFQSFVAPEVVNEMLQHPEKLRLGGEKRELTVMFSDIRGFTTLAENMEAETLVSLLHAYLTPMTEIVFKHGGTVDKYIGDALMAIYGAPLDLPEHADQAVRTALEMTAVLKQLCREWQPRGWPEIKIGVGINSGLMSVGNMGSERLFDYTVIGDDVNLASRLEGLNKQYGTEILVSEFTARRLQNSFILREVDRVRVKGKQVSVSIFEVRGQGPPTAAEAQFLETFHQALTAFRQCQWEQAERLLTDCLSSHPNDNPARKLLSRCRQFAQNPPPPDWDGTATLSEK